jgi:uncharacterized protein
MGASIALLAAAECPDISAMVLDSPFCSLRRISGEWTRRIVKLPELLLRIPLQLAYIWLLLWDKCDVPQVEPASRVKSVLCPLFLIHGGSDGMIPAEHSRLIYENAPGEKELWVVEGVDHLGMYLLHEKEYERRVLEFFARHLLAETEVDTEVERKIG